MKTKKLYSILFAFVAVVGLMTGCGSSGGNQTAETNGSDSETENAAQNDEQTSETVSEETTETETTGNGKTLVVYYSASGNTKGVAETIADITGGDLFEIVPTQVYTSDDLDWTNKDSRVSREHDDESLRDVELVSTTVDGWDSYDTVYIGYPIWWGIAAWPVDGFVKANDFTGKTVIPFCTAASSGIGNSGNLLKDMAGTGDWKDGERFHGGASESDIRTWIDSLGL